VVIEYHPQGLFEKTGNIWRAQGRRIRLELKNFQREVMTQTLLHPDEVEGWHGEIHDGEVVDDGRDENDENEKERRTKTTSRAKQGRTTDESRTPKRTSSSRASGRTNSSRRRAPAKGGSRA
jgi:hypothetical protein